MLGRISFAFLALSFVGQAAVAADCGARDFLAMPLPKAANPVLQALEGAYPGLRRNGAADGVVMPNGTVLALGHDKDRPALQRLASASIAEQFHDIYPLTFDPEPRKTPFFDPGRARNDQFFRSLYFENKKDAKASLAKVAYAGRGHARYFMTKRNAVHCQLATAMAAVADLAVAGHPAMRDVGGSFNWRTISGTNRLSAHSFGIAFDLNANLGGYWKWSGKPEGNVGEYNNKIPLEIVATFERFGFIWGGKWHHYDGMHFEYRPELILYARLMADK